MTCSSAPSTSTGLRLRLEDFVRALRNWTALARAQSRMREEFSRLEQTGVLEEVLRDVNITKVDFEALMNADPKTCGRLEEMIGRLGLTDRLHTGRVAVMRDVQRVCQWCESTDVCDHWLGGEINRSIEEFCPNAPTFAALRPKKG